MTDWTLLKKKQKEERIERVNKKPKATGHWTKETLQDEANKYNNRNEFRKYASGAYDAALTLKIVDKLFKNHYNKGFKDDIIKNKGYWDKEKLQKESAFNISKKWMN